MASTCGNCGGPLAAGDAFCGGCGTPNGRTTITTTPEPHGAEQEPSGSDQLVPEARKASPAPPAPSRPGDGGQASPSQAAPWPRRDEPGPVPRSTSQGAGGRSAAEARVPLASGAGQGAARARARPAPGGGAPRQDAAAKPATAALADHAENLRHKDAGLAYVTMAGRANFDPLYNKRFMFQLLRQAGIFVGLYALIDVVVSIFFLLAGLAGGLRTLSAFSAWTVFYILLSIALAALFWLLPIPALLAQWSLLLQHKADAVETAFAHVDVAFRQHQTPLDILQKKSISPPGEGRREYIELRQGLFTGYISCFAHGRDMYVGWTYWLRLSPLRWLLMIIGRKIQEYSGRGSDIYQTLRFESARATVAAMHDAVLEGIDAATAELDPESPRLIGQQAAEFGFNID
jgi:hypothetical protein